MTAESDIDVGAGVVVDRAVVVAVAKTHVGAGFLVIRAIDVAVAILHVGSGVVILVDGAVNISAAGDVKENSINR